MTVTSNHEALSESVSPEERERAVEVLATHFAADRLTDAALEVRLQRVYAAQTRQELNAVIADLPAHSAADPAMVPATRGHSTVKAVLSGQERSLTGAVPRELQLRARLGYIQMDLAGAQFEPGLTTIDVRAFMGYVEIRLPPGIRVENEGRAVVGFFSGRGARASDGPAEARSTVRITGRVLFGFAKAATA